MELREFIHWALVDISAGVQEAAVDCREIVAIAPGSIDGENVVVESNIEFDIAIVISDESKKSLNQGGNVGAKISVAAFQVSAGGKRQHDSKSSAKTEETNRLKFSVPIRFNAHFRGAKDGESLAAETKAAISRLPRR